MLTQETTARRGVPREAATQPPAPLSLLRWCLATSPSFVLVVAAAALYKGPSLTDLAPFSSSITNTCCCIRWMVLSPP